MKLTEIIRTLVEEEARKPTNIYTYSAFTHISLVVKFAKLLAQRLNGDEEIVELAGWLHDYGSLIGKYENHNVTSMIEAERILTSFNYPLERLEKVKHCIYAHRGSKDIKRETLEAKIVTSADAMSHFADLPDLFHLAYSTHKLDSEAGKTFVIEKLKRDWKKIELSEGKEIIKPYYDIAQKILNEVII